jgi:hypothetical protein
MRTLSILLAILATLALGAAEGDHEHKHQGTDHAKPAAEAAADPDAKPVPYPLTTCIVAGEPLGGMGEPVVQVHNGQEVKFCCKSCIRDFKADPATYLAKLEQAKAEMKDEAKPAEDSSKPAHKTDHGHQH